MKQLTIAITTYNRKNSLLKQLKRIENQAKIDKYNLVISDNCSNYDINEYLKNNLSKEFYENIQLHINPFNINSIGNISNIFMLPKTKWMWLLSDDDVVTPDSLEVVLSDINVDSSIGIYKYHLTNNNKESITIENFDELINYYGCKENSIGSFIFISNNLYNLEVLQPFIHTVFDYSYTNIPHINPIIEGLSKNKIKMIASNKIIVNYEYPGRDKHWNYVPVMLGLSIIENIYINLSEKQVRRFMNLLSGNFTHIILYKYCLDIEERSRRVFIYNKVFKTYYSRRNNFSDWGIYILFHIQFYTELDIIKIGQNIKRLLGIHN